MLRFSNYFLNLVKEVANENNCYDKFEEIGHVVTKLTMI